MSQPTSNPGEITASAAKSAGEAASEHPLTARRVLTVVARDLLLVVLAAVCFLGFLTLGSRANTDASDPTVGSGVARPRSCERYGPVSTSGFGYWYSCQAVVRWHGPHGWGPYKSVMTLQTSTFTPADIGHDVAIVVHSGQKGGFSFSRAGVKSHPWVFVSGILLAVLGMIFMVQPLWDLGMLYRRVRRARRASGQP